MKILGKSRGVATVIAVALGLAIVSGADGSVAAAQMAPTGLPSPVSPPPAAKPVPAGQPAAAGATKPSAPAAGAQPASKPAAPAKPADAKALAASGEKKFKAGDFAGALADFEASDTAKAAPETERFIGLSHDNLGHYPEAVAAYEKFLATSPVPASMKQQGDETKKRVDAIKTMPGKVHVETTPAGAQITVDLAANPSAQPNAAPTPTDLDLPAGHHTLKIAAEGFTTVDKEVDVTYASKQDVRVELVKSEPPPPPPPPVVAEVAQPAPPPPPPPEPRSKVPAYVTGAVAIIATGVGIGFGVKALGQSSDFDKNPTTKKADDGENNALVADMMFGIAITFGVTSAVLFLSSDAPQSAKADPADKNRPAVAVAVKKPAKITITPTPYLTPSGGGAGAVVRF
jgi:hypothetical protein